MQLAQYCDTTIVCSGCILDLPLRKSAAASPFANICGVAYKSMGPQARETISSRVHKHDSQRGSQFRRALVDHWDFGAVEDEEFLGHTYRGQS